MSEFKVEIVKIDKIDSIENADFIEVAKIADYKSIVKKGQFEQGDLAVYIPESSIVPDWLLKRLGLEGKLAGSNKNRVKAVKLRGTLSQGILYPLIKRTIQDELYPEITNQEWTLYTENPEWFKSVPPAIDKNYVGVYEGLDVASILGIEKYVPPIPTSMAGEIVGIGPENTVRYDIENLKKYPDVLKQNEEIVATEKIHGTLMIIGYVPGLNNPEIIEGDVFLASKGLGAQGKVFKDNERNKERDKNVYYRVFQELGKDFVKRLKTVVIASQTPFYILGEVFGSGVQDLQYGCKQNELKFRVFDIFAGTEKRAIDYEQMIKKCKELNLEPVPLLYRGPYSRTTIDQLCFGNTIEGDGKHIMEGIVIRPTKERSDPKLGRVILKHVSEAYLIRKGGTEYN